MAIYNPRLFVAIYKHDCIIIIIIRMVHGMDIHVYIYIVRIIIVLVFVIINYFFTTNIYLLLL